VILRRHLAKMHLCLKDDFNEEELDDDAETIMYIGDVLWDRYCELLGQDPLSYAWTWLNIHSQSYSKLNN
jgi:hypothetical protein